MFEIFDNLCYKQSSMENKIELPNTQHQYPYLILIHIIFFYFVGYATEVITDHHM